MEFELELELELVLGLRLDACQSHLKIESKIWAEQHASVFVYTHEEGIFLLRGYIYFDMVFATPTMR